jgi:hypothetical protein
MIFKQAGIVFFCAFLTVTPILLYPWADASAQTHTSLFGWNERMQQILLNQYHNYGGPFYDRGVFRIYTPPMTKEHDLDLVTYEFSVLDDHDWYYQERNSFRTFVGSFDLGEFLHGISLRNYIPVAPGVTLPVTVERRYDMRSDRTVVWLGLDYAFRDMHSLGFLQSLSEQKADLNAMFYYRFGSTATGWIQAEITFMDWPNNAIYGLGEQRGTDYLNSRKHEKHPYLFSFKAASPVWNQFRGELMGGLKTRSRSKVGPVGNDELNTLDFQRAHYFGALAEWANPHITLALTWQTQYANFRRSNYLDISHISQPGQPGSDDEIRYGNFQWQNTLGGAVVLQYGQFRLYNRVQHSWIRDRERDIHQRPSQWYSDILFTPFDYREWRWTLRSRLSWVPDNTGFTAALEWASMYHDMDSDYQFEFIGRPVRAFDYRQLYELASINERLTLSLGYRFSNKSRIEIGASYDVDGDREQGYYDYMTDRAPRRFDGGFGRLTVFW